MTIIDILTQLKQLNKTAVGRFNENLQSQLALFISS